MHSSVDRVGDTSGQLVTVSTRRRCAAWLADSIFVAVPTLLALLASLAFGALGLNEQAQGQMRLAPQTDAQYDSSGTHPYQFVTAPLIHADLSRLTLILAAYLAVAAIYYAGSWVRAGATPGQRLFGMSVVSDGTGSRLSPSRALGRWAVLSGLGSATSVASVTAAWVILSASDWLAKTPTNMWLTTPNMTLQALAANGLASGWCVTVLAGCLWSAVLLTSVRLRPAGRGFHDLIAGSVVVRNCDGQTYGKGVR